MIGPATPPRSLPFFFYFPVRVTRPETGVIVQGGHLDRQLGGHATTARSQMLGRNGCNNTGTAGIQANSAKPLSLTLNSSMLVLLEQP